MDTAMRSRGNARITPLLTITILAVFSFILEDFNLSLSLGYGLFMVLALFWAILIHKLTVTKTQIAALFLAFVATVMVFLPYARTAMNTVTVILSLDIAMVYTLLSRPDADDVKRTLHIILIAAVLMSCYAIAVNIFPDLYYNIVKRILPSNTQALIERGFRYGYGVYVGKESILVSYYGFFGLVISLNTLMIKKATSKTRNKFIIVSIICSLAIIMQNRKSELLVALIVVAFLFLSNVNVTTLKKKIKQIIAFSAVAVVAVSGFVYLLNHGYLSRYEILLTKLLEGRYGARVDISSGRFGLWERAFSLFKENPIFGIGWGNYRKYISEIINGITEVQIGNVHNNYLQLLCETGVVGFLCFTIPLFYIFGRTFKCINNIRKQKIENELVRIAASTSISIQLFYLVISFIDPVWYKMFTWPFLGIAFILLNYVEKESIAISQSVR